MPSQGPVRAVHQVLVSHLVGGAGFLAIGLAAAMRQRGIESLGWVPAAGPASEALDREGVPWWSYRLDRLKRGGAAQTLALAGIGARLTAAGRPLVHVHNPLVYGLMSPVLRALRARAIVQFHIDPSEDEVRWALRHPPAAVGTCSRYIAGLVRDLTTRAGRTIPVFPLPNAIDVDRYGQLGRAAARQRAGARADRPLVVMLANLAEHKGQLTAVHAVRHLKDRGVLVDCWLAGEEREPGQTFTARLREAVRDLGVAEQVAFLGFRRDGALLLEAADFFLLPSTHEGLPLSVLEAQAAGAVVLASPLPGVREVVADGETGFLIDPADHEGYAERIHSLLSDRARAARVTAAAGARVRAEHSWSVYLDRAWQMYRAVEDRA